MNASDIEARLAEDDRAWAELVAKLDAHPDVNLHAPGSVPWNSRDVYAHLARWLEFNTANLQALLAGHHPADPGKDYDGLNARWQAEDASLSLEEARQWAMMAYEVRKRTIAAIPPSLWSGDIREQIGLEGAVHFRDHLSWITLTDAHPYPGASRPQSTPQGGGMYEIVVEKHFEAAHYLRGYQGKCEAMHGHRYMVKVRIKVAELNDIGLAYDFGDIKVHLNQIMDRYDHTCLNDITPFDVINPSAENIAATIYKELAEKLAAEPVTLAAVEAWETPHQGVIYTPD